MFNRIAGFALCLALLSLSACAGVGGQTRGSAHARGTAQSQKPLLFELLVISAAIDHERGKGGADRGSDRGSDSGNGSRGGEVLLALGATAAIAGAAYLMLSSSGDVDGVESPATPHKSNNNVSTSPDFIQAAQRGAL